MFCVCGSGLGNLCFLVCIIISLIIWFCMCVYRVYSGMHDTELLEEKRFCWAGQSSDVEPGEHDEQGQGRTASHKFMHILGKVYFVGHTARAGAAARFLFVSSAFVMKWD